MIDPQTSSEISHLDETHDDIKAAVTERNCYVLGGDGSWGTSKWKYGWMAG